MNTVDIKALVKQNQNFRTVIFTGKHSQVVAMSIAVGDDIGEEVHPDTDQTFVLIEGVGKAVVNGEESIFEADQLIFVPAGTKHNFINTGEKALKLFTIYAPPQHPENTIHATKEDAVKAHV